MKIADIVTFETGFQAVAEASFYEPITLLPVTCNGEVLGVVIEHYDRLGASELALDGIYFDCRPHAVGDGLQTITGEKIGTMHGVECCELMERAEFFDNARHIQANFPWVEGQLLTGLAVSFAYETVAGIDVCEQNSCPENETWGYCGACGDDSLAAIGWTLIAVVEDAE